MFSFLGLLFPEGVFSEGGRGIEDGWGKTVLKC